MGGHHHHLQVGREPAFGHHRDWLLVAHRSRRNRPGDANAFSLHAVHRLRSQLFLGHVAAAAQCLHVGFVVAGTRIRAAHRCLSGCLILGIQDVARSRHRVGNHCEAVLHRSNRRHRQVHAHLAANPSVGVAIDLRLRLIADLVAVGQYGLTSDDQLGAERYALHNLAVAELAARHGRAAHEHPLVARRRRRRALRD